MNPTDEAVRAELRRIILSVGFVHSERLRRFLTYSVEQALAGCPQNLKEYSIGVEAFDRPKQYSPSEDPIVRVEARRLRQKLAEYYAGAGASNPVRIELPKGSYVPVFVDCTPPVPLADLTPARSRIPLWIPFIAAAMAMAGALVVSWLNFKRPVNSAQMLTRLTSDAGLTTDPALSLDGQWLAYASDRGGSNLNIWIRRTGASAEDARRLTAASVDHHQPALSPRGDSIAYRAEGEIAGIYAMKSAGGNARLLAKDGRDPQYSPDGARIAFWSGSPGDDLLPPAGRIFLVAPGGAPEQPVPLIEESFASAACPVWSPDGSRILFIGVEGSAGQPDWWTVPMAAASPEQRKPTPTGAVAILARNGLQLPFRECTASWQPSGLIFAARGGDTQNLWRLPLDPSGRARATLERLTFGSAAEWRPVSSSTGAVVFSSRIARSRIWTLSNSSREPAAIATGSSDVSFPSASRNGRYVAFLTGSGGNVHLWWRDLESGRELQLAQAPIQPRYPQISPDGARVVFIDHSSDPDGVFAASPGSGHLQPLPIPAGRIWDWTGDLILYQRPGSRKEFEEFNLQTGHTRTLVKAPVDLAGPRLSPDLSRIAWHAIPSLLRRQLFVAPYTEPGTAAALIENDAMDRNCAWSPDGRTLYFLSDRDGYRCIWKKSIGNNHSPEPVCHFHSSRQSLAGFGDVGAIGLSATSAGLVFAVSESASNLWALEQVRKQ